MQNDILLKHLSTIVDPELGVDIVELGMVKDISFVDSTVVIKLALTIAECPMRNQIETEIKRKLLLMENDFTEQYGEVAIVVDNQSVDHIRGATLDYKEGLNETGFSIDNPNVSRTCGCGNSFS